MPELGQDPVSGASTQNLFMRCSRSISRSISQTNRDKCAIDNRSLQVEVPTNLIQGSWGAIKRWSKPLRKWRLVQQSKAKGRNQHKLTDCAFNAEVNWESVKVLVVEGVIPSFDNQVNVGSVWGVHQSERLFKAVGPAWHGGEMSELGTDLEKFDNGLEEGYSLS